MHLVCPHCQATNRVATTDLHKSLDCGSCHQPLFNQHTVAVDALGFEKQVKHSDVPVIVDFWAEWCGPCRMMAPEFEKACQQLEPNARFLKVDSDAEQRLSGQLKIRGIPTLIIFKKGQEVARVSGARSATQLVEWIQPHLN
jgi:thioredoxin 2